MWSLRLVQLKLILLLVWSFSEYTDATRLQMFTLYNDTGQSENYTTNVHDLEKVSNLVKSEELTSVCSQIGVWAFFSNKDFADKDAYGYHPATPEWSCNQRRIGADHGFAAVNSIRHLGSGDLDISALSLYKEPYFASDELYFDGDIISLPITHKFYSFGFTGNESWTLYINTNFTGDMVCLRPNLSEESGVTYRTEQLLIVGSIVKGCLRTPRLLPIGEVYRQNDSQNQIEDPDISNLISQKSPSHCLELQDAFYTSPLLVSGNELRLPEPEPFDSFTLQKNSSWTIFKGMEFDGESMCLKNNDSDSNSTTEAINYRFVSSPFLVGSVRQGCEEINQTEGSKTYFNSNSTNPPDNLNTMTTSTENPLNGPVSTFSPNNSLDNSTESSNTENPEEITDMVTSSTDTIETETTEPTTGEGTSISNRLGSSTRRGKQLFDDRTTTSIYDNETDIMTTMNPKSELSSNSSSSGLESTINSNGTTTTVSTTNSSVTPTPESTTNSNGTTTSVSTTNSSVTRTPESTTNSSGTTTPESMTNSSGTTTSESMTNSSGTTTSASKTNPSGTTTLESTTNFSGTTAPESTTNSSGTTTSVPKSNSSSAPTTTSGPLISDVESNITSVKANSTKSENLTNSNSTGTKPEELISNAGSGGLFFTAFIIVLGLLILCMLITLGLFVYFRATRHRDTEELAG